ncbi:KAP family P-loop NTPase fold protein [Cupriavidus sp. CP313]
MSTHTPTPLVLGPASLDSIDEPFEGDLLGRQEIAQRLTAYLDRLRVGAVVAIDAPWGEGKTWFGRHWAKHLEKLGHRVGVIDAFQQDYAEDAFLLLAGAILKLCEEHSGPVGMLKHRAGAVLRALLPLGTKALINLAGRAIGTSDIVGKYDDAVDQATEKSADAASAWVKRRFDDWEEEQKTVQHFRAALTEFAEATFKATGKPVVILVDELDRCRPGFAVRVIERIKHFFDVPHLVFVLLMNRDQLEKAIRGVYGPETDANTYLGKFLHLSLRLPTARSVEPDATIPGLSAFVFDALNRIGVNDHEFAQDFSHCAVIFELSARDVERGCTLYGLATTTNGRPNAALLAYCIALKLKRPEMYAGLLMSRGETHAECQALLEGIPKALEMRDPFGITAVAEMSLLTTYLTALIVLHSRWLYRHARENLREYGVTNEADAAFKAHFPKQQDDVQALFLKTLRRLDLAVE